MVKRLLCGGLLALVLAPIPAHADPEPEDVWEHVPPVPDAMALLTELLAPLQVKPGDLPSDWVNESCIRNYENLEGNVCTPVEDDYGMVQFAMDRI